MTRPALIPPLSGSAGSPINFVDPQQSKEQEMAKSVSQSAQEILLAPALPSFSNQKDLAAFTTDIAPAIVEQTEATEEASRILGTTTSEKKENIQMRFSRLIAKILEILAEMSLDEKAKINLIKKEIKEFTDIQAKSIKSQGWVALGTAIGGVVCTGISAFLPAKPGFNLLKEMLPKIGEVGKDTAARFLNAHFDEKSVRAQSEKDVDLRQMDTSNNDVEAKAGSRRDITDLWKEILATASTASRPQ
jgi:hypothetical protein